MVFDKNHDFEISKELVGIFRHNNKLAISHTSFHSYVLCKDEQCFELLCQSEDKTRVVHKGLDGTFVTSVEEQGTSTLEVCVCACGSDGK